MARCRWAVAPLLRQRAVGVRRAWPDAPARGEHQRYRDRRERPALPLARTGPATDRRAGIERQPILTNRALFSLSFSVAPAPITTGRSVRARFRTHRPTERFRYGSLRSQGRR